MAHAPAAALRRYAAPVAGALFLSWLVAFAWWVMTPQARTVDLDIPAGAAAQVAAGVVPDALPSRLVMRIGDTLAVRNADSVPHRIGPVFLAPGASSRLSVTPALLGARGVLCSAHPGGALAVAPRTRPGLLLTLPIALAAGLPLSLALIATLAVVERLDTGDRGRSTVVRSTVVR